MEESAKKNLKTYGIFFGIIIFMSAVLIASILFHCWSKSASPPDVCIYKEIYDMQTSGGEADFDQQ